MFGIFVVYELINLCTYVNFEKYICGNFQSLTKRVRGRITTFSVSGRTLSKMSETQNVSIRSDRGGQHFSNKS